MAKVILQVPHSTPMFYTGTLGSEHHIIPWLLELFDFPALALGSSSRSCSGSGSLALASVLALSSRFWRSLWLFALAL